MIHFDYEEAICDNPVTSFFFPWTASGCGWISPIHFAWPLACSGSRLCPNPWPVSTWEYFAQIILLPWDVHWVYEWMYKPISSAAGAEKCECDWHFSPGAQKGGAAPCPCASPAPGGAGRAPKADLETPPPQNHWVTLRQDLVHPLGKTSWV